MTHFGVLKNAIVKLGATAYQANVKTALFKPETSTSSYPVLVPEGAIQDVDNPVWTLQLVGLQDWQTGGLAKYLTDHHGEQVTAIVTPQATDTWPEVTATVIAMAAPIGGTAGEFAEFDLTLPVVGQPAVGAYDATP